MIVLKSARELAHMRAGGQILAAVKERLRVLVRPGVTTKEIDVDVEAFIVARGAKSAFKGYRGYPATVCTSINQEVVHGIPSEKRRLAEGDIIGLDLGCIVEGYYADCAVTLAVGAVPPRVQELLDVTRESLDKAIVQCRATSDLNSDTAAKQLPGKARNLVFQKSGKPGKYGDSRCQEPFRVCRRSGEIYYGGW